MQFDDRGLDYAFDPLKVVDVKTMTSIAEALKKSNDKSTRAVGVFLDRINRLRITDPGSPEDVPNAKAGSDRRKASGLHDLRD